MADLRQVVADIPGAKALWRRLRSVPGQLRGLPPITYADLTTELIRSVIGRDDPTILDIGCNDGSTTLWMLDIFKAPRLYCFEPDPRAIERFKAKVGERPQVTLLEMALSDRQGSIDFYQSGGRRDNEWLVKAMPQGWDLSGSIRQPYRHLELHPQVTFDQKISVVTSTLDAVCEEHGIGPVDLIWLDVQGAELDVFAGAGRTLAQTRYLYTEYSDRELYKGQVGLSRMVAHLPGFRVLMRYPGDALLRNEALTALRSDV